MFLCLAVLLLNGGLRSDLDGKVGMNVFTNWNCLIRIEYFLHNFKKIIKIIIEISLNVHICRAKHF